MDPLESFIFVGNLLYVATYFTERLLRVRMMTLCAGCCLVVYHALRPDPIVSILGWNVFFVALNLVHLMRLRARTAQGDADRFAGEASVEVSSRQPPRSPQAEGIFLG